MCRVLKGSVGTRHCSLAFCWGFCACLWDLLSPGPSPWSAILPPFTLTQRPHGLPSSCYDPAQDAHRTRGKGSGPCTSSWKASLPLRVPDGAQDARLTQSFVLAPVPLLPSWPSPWAPAPALLPNSRVSEAVRSGGGARLSQHTVGALDTDGAEIHRETGGMGRAATCLHAGRGGTPPGRYRACEGRKGFGQARCREGLPAEECGLAPPLPPGGTEADGSWGVEDKGEAQPAQPEAPRQ